MTIRLPLLWLSLSFIAGLLLASQVSLAVSIWLALSCITLVLALTCFFLARRFGWRPLGTPPATFLVLILSITFCFLGSARYQASQPVIEPSHVAWYNDREGDVLVTGIVAEPPDSRDSYTNLRLKVTSLDAGDGSVSEVNGLILARVSPGETYRYGEKLRLRGTLQTPPENEEFSYRDYLARQGILAYMPYASVTRLPGGGGNPALAALYGIKDHSIQTIYRIFPDPEASLLAGILLGVDSGLQPDLQRAFRDTGTAHIIAISGFNIAILSSIFVSLFGRILGQRRGVLVAILLIAIYTVLVGAEASVVRAAVMGTLSLFARQVGRRQDGLNTLAFTAAGLAVFNPNLPWDVGFQLSFSATLGLILYAQPFQKAAEKILAWRLPVETANKVATLFAEYVLFTLAAQLTVLPVMAWHFGRISLISLVANPFILPAQPPLMILGGLALLLGMVSLPLGRVVASLAWPFPAYTIRAVELFGRIPGGVMVLDRFPFLFVVLFYGILLGFTFLGDRMKRLRAVFTPAAIIAGLGILVFVVWKAVAVLPDGNLHLTILDAGSADAILIQTPAGRNVLVNGGASPSRLSDALGRRLSPFHRTLDYLVVGSPQQEQLAALPRTLDRYPPAAALWAGNREASSASRQLDEFLTDRSTPINYANSGEGLDLGSGAVLRVVSSSPRGAILLLEWGGFRALLPTGADFGALERLENGEAIGPVTALLLADSGYAPVNPPEWIANLRPRVAILSVGTADPSGLPDDHTLDAVAFYTLLRTDVNGWIHLETDGKQLWVEVEKPDIEE